MHFSTQPWRIEANTFAQALRWVPLNGAVSAKQLQWLEEFEGEVEGVRCREERDRRTEDQKEKTSRWKKIAWFQVQKLCWSSQLALMLRGRCSLTWSTDLHGVAGSKV